MRNWTFTDNSNSVVDRINANGSYESCLVGSIADWIAEGNTPEPYVAPPAAPIRVITMRQARLALNAANLLTTVNAAVAASSEQVKIEWEYAQELKRDWPTLIAMVEALELSEADIDALFLAASTL